MRRRDPSPGSKAERFASRWKAAFRRRAQCAVQTMQGSNERTTCWTAAAVARRARRHRGRERAFERAGPARGVARREIPGRRRDDLIALDLAVARRRPNGRARRAPPRRGRGRGRLRRAAHRRSQNASCDRSARVQPSIAWVSSAISSTRAMMRARTVEPPSRAAGRGSADGRRPPAAPARRPPPACRDRAAPWPSYRRRRCRASGSVSRLRGIGGAVAHTGVRDILGRSPPARERLGRAVEASAGAQTMRRPAP